MAFQLRLFLYQQLFWKQGISGGMGSTNHKGIDIPAPTGTPIYAAASGTIVAMLPPASSGGAGYYTKINHDGKGLITEYMHQSKFNPNLSVGDKVKKGDIIGYVGTPGTAPVLIFILGLWLMG